MAKWAAMWTGSIVVFVILGFLTPGAFAADAWCDLSTCDTNWSFRKKITIQNGQVAGTSHTDFAVLISLSSDTDLNSSNVQSAGEDIRFTNEDGSAVLSYEIESFSNNITDGTLVAWVKIPTLSATADTVLYMYYGNSGASSTANAANVWDSNYVGVYHLKQTSFGASTTLDSTSNNNDGSPAGNPVAESSGQIDGAVDFDGTGDWVDVPDDASLDIQQAITIESWFRMDGTSGDIPFPRLVSKGQSTTTNGAYGIFFEDTGSAGFFWGLRFIDSGDTRRDIAKAEDFGQKDGNWHYIVGTYSNAVDEGKIYFDGDLKQTTPLAGDIAIKQTMDTLQIGAGNSEREFNGAIDEVRISNIVRSEDFITTEYNNQNSPGTFYSTSSEQDFLSTPPSLSADQGNTQVSLEWTAPTTGSSTITDYTVEHKLSSSDTWLTFNDGVSTSTSATVTGLTNDLSYDFRVSATSSGVLGSTSSTVTIEPATTATKTTEAFSTSVNISFDDATVTATGSDTITIEKLNSNPEASSPSGTTAGSFYDITASGALSGTVILSYSDADIAGLIESSLTINRFSGGIWSALATTVDTSANTATATTPGFSSFVLSGTSASTGSVDTIKPSFITAFAENEYPITIDGTTFKMSDLATKVDTVIVETGKPILVKVLVSDETHPSEIRHVNLLTNLLGTSSQIHGDTGIYFQSGNPPTVIDPNGYFSNVDVSTSIKNNKLEVIFDITFAKEMDASDLIVHARDRGNNVGILKVYDAWQVIQAPTAVETTETIIVELADVSVPVEIKVKTLNVEKPAYSMQEEILFYGNVDGYKFGSVVSIIIRNPSNGFLTLISTFPDKDGYYETKIRTDSKFKTDGTYSATAFADDPNRGTRAIFYFSREVPPPPPVITSPSQSIQVESTTTAEPTIPAELVTPKPKPRHSFVDLDKDPQSYVDRYNTEPTYKNWFDSNFPDYTIYEAVGLSEPAKEKVPAWIQNNAKWWSEGQIDDGTFVSGIQFLMTEKIIDIPDLPEQASEKARPSFVDPQKDPQSYIDRYNNEASYKEWFDKNHPDYTIEEAVGIPEPIPGWIKNNAEWWADGQISEDDFVGGIEWLVEQGIIKV